MWTLLVALACAESLPKVHERPAPPRALEVHALSDSYGTSYPVDSIQLEAPQDLAIQSLELQRHDGSVTPLEITRRSEENGRLRLHFEAVEANEGVRFRAFVVTLEGGQKIEAVVTYTEEFDGLE